MANKKFWYPRYWADYQDKTKHLTLVQHGAYILLLDYYYSRNGDVVAIATDLLRICSSRTKEEDDAVMFILDNFFSVKDGKYVNCRADDEMKITRKISVARKVAGSKGGSKTVANRAAKEYTDTDTDTDTDTLSTKESTKEKPNTPLSRLVSLKINNQIAKDWIALRNKQKAPVTSTVIKSFQKKAGKANMTLEEVLVLCIDKSWRGFEPEWLDYETNRANGSSIAKIAWWDTEEASETKGIEIGCKRLPDEDLGVYRERIQQHINDRTGYD